MKRSVYNLSRVYACTLVLMLLCEGVWMELGYYSKALLGLQCSAVMILAAF